ncbi:MAG: hypothetical protein HY402_00965, partial [Elusimicrobia bacterium]|nr:hypothetical protein [Elusimicrobiota bacterium]
ADHNAISLSTLIGQSWDGFLVWNADSNTVTQSYLWGGWFGAAIDTGSDYNTISLSTMIGQSWYGLYADGADSNRVTQS